MVLIEYSQITNQTLHSFSSIVKCFSDECQLPIAHLVFNQSDQNIHQLQLHIIKVCCKMIWLPYQWTFASNHIVTSLSAGQCISHSIPALRIVHLLLFLQQNLTLVNCQFRIMYFDLKPYFVNTVNYNLLQLQT